MRRIFPRQPRSLRSVPRRRRVLALVGDTQVGLWVTRSLARNGLKVVSVCRTPAGQAAHSRYSADAWMLESKAHEPSFADELAQLARRLEVGSVMTIAEGYHRALIRCRDRLEPEVHVFSPEARCFETATDKDAMHALCVRLGVPVARGATLAKLLAGEVELRFPLVLRKIGRAHV
mgnify:CR=1 FL=1